MTPSHAHRQRVLILLAPYLPGYRSGGPVQSISKMIELLSSHFEFFVLTNDRDTGDAEPYKSVRTGEWQSLGGAKVFYSKHLNSGAILNAIRQVSPDMLYLHSFYDTLTNRALLLRKANSGANLPVVLAPRGEFSAGALSIKAKKKRMFRILSKFTGLHKDVVWHASSEGEREDILAELGTVRVVLARTPVFLTEEELRAIATKPPKQPGSISLIFAARISPMKNLHFLTDILQKVRGAIDLEICGPVDAKDEAYWRMCRVRLQELPPNVRVHYHGGLPHLEALTAISRSHLFILPTLGENFGHSIAESLLSETPAIISDNTPWRGLGSYNAGFDLSLSDPSAWVRSLQAMIDCDQIEYSSMREGARRFMKGYSLQRSITDFEELFSSPVVHAEPAVKGAECL